MDMTYTNEALQNKFYSYSTPLSKVKECFKLVSENDKKKCRMIGIARDLSLLEWLAVNKYTDFYMSGLITMNPHEANLYKQIARLVKCGLLKKLNLRGVSLWRITKAGINYLNQESSTKYRTNIVTGKTSDILFSHTMCVQVGLYNLLISNIEESRFIGEFDIASLSTWLDKVDAKIPKVPDLILYMPHKVTAFEIELKPKKDHDVQRALFGMDQILNKEIADWAEYYFLKEESANLYEKYLQTHLNIETGNYEYNVSYSYDRLGDLIRTDGKKIVRSLEEVRSRATIHRSHPQKNNDGELEDLFQFNRYFKMEKPPSRNSTVKKAAFDLWIHKAQTLLTNTNERDFQLTQKFISEVIKGKFHSVLALPKNKRKLLSELLLLVDAQDYDENELLNFSEHLESLTKALD
jgi:hypothetical protein